MPRPVRVLLALTGSVAAIKVTQLLAELRREEGKYDVRVMATSAAMHFIERADDGRPGDQILQDSDEWSAWNGRGDDVVHIELRSWADILLIGTLRDWARHVPEPRADDHPRVPTAPLGANTLAKAVNGMCDNLVTCVLRAWDVSDASRPIIAAPAMNTMMYAHPLTAEQLQRAREVLHMHIVDPIVKTLACGDVGVGAMAALPTIVDAVDRAAANLVAPRLSREAESA